MYRYIKAARYDESAKAKENLIGIRQDIRLISQMNSYEEAIANQNKFQTINVPNELDKYMNRRGMDFDSAVDQIIDDLHEWSVYFKQQSSSYADKEAKMLAVADDIKDALVSQYNLYSINQYAMYIEPEVGDHDELVEIADEVESIIGGRYYGTGRGGSWTKYNLRSNDDVCVNVGFVGSTDNFAPKGTILIEVVYNN